MILIVTTEGDLHALAVKRELARYHVACAILAVDRVAQDRRLSLHLDGHETRATLWCADGANPLSLSDVRVIWLRRPRADQLGLDPSLSDTARSLIHNESRGAVSGLLTSSFRGKWVSAPHATYRASDKLYQLRVARDCGFPIPATLVSQDRQEVQDFFARHDGRIVVKSIVGVEDAFLLTRAMPRPLDIPEEAFRMSPSLYQANIPGTRHIRLTCFGENSLAALIESEDLDWRPNLNVPVSEWTVPADVHRRVRSVLDALELEMGIVDLKQTPTGDLVWLEVNPQGQFLFLEGLTKLSLAKRFADYLMHTAAS